MVKIMNLDHILVVCKRSTLYFYEKSPDEKTQEYATGDNEYARRLRSADESNERTIESLTRDLNSTGLTYSIVHRADFKDLDPIADLIVTVGGDGTLIDVSHYVTDSTPLFGVNSDPARSRGHFCGSTAETFLTHLEGIDALPRYSLNRLEATIDGIVIPHYALNEITLRSKDPEDMVRYVFETDGVVEEHRNDRFFVCTAAGSTAWIKSNHGLIMPLDSMEKQCVQVGSFKPHEPQFTQGDIRLHSYSREGILTIDGKHKRCEFGLGSEIAIKNGKPLIVIGDIQANRIALYG